VDLETQKGREELIEWELGTGDDGYIPGEVKYTAIALYVVIYMREPWS
jgi:hypothetical protein